MNNGGILQVNVHRSYQQKREGNVFLNYHPRMLSEYLFYSEDKTYSLTLLLLFIPAAKVK